MRRRSYLTLAGGAVVGLAGCTAGEIPGKAPADDPLSTADCPDLLDAVWTCCPDEGDGPLSVDRSVEGDSAEAWTVQISVTNRDTKPFEYNPFAWSVFHRREAGWRRLGPAARVEPRAELAPGDRHAWQLVAAGAGPVEAVQRVFLDLEPGRYAFAVPFHGADPVAAVAPFAIPA